MEEDEHTTLSRIGRVFRLNVLRALKERAPKVFPQDHFEPAAKHSLKKDRKNKTYGILIPSDQGMILDSNSKTVHLHHDQGGVDLKFCRRLLMDNWSEKSKSLMQIYGRTEAPLRVFDLEMLGLKLIACPDPRPELWLRSESKIRITEWLVEEDNQLAIYLTMANCNFDMIQLRDIFGPILVTRHPFGRDLKLNHLRSFIKSYFGHSGHLGGFADLFGQGLASLDTEDFGATENALCKAIPKPVREAIQQQKDGLSPATDLLTYAGPKYTLPGFAGKCASCNRLLNTRKACGRCKAVYYCSKECQLTDWKEHRPQCCLAATERE
jgi:hypothetical protein